MINVHGSEDYEMESILDSVKEKIGIDSSETHFDSQLIDYINSALAELHQVGVNETPFFISDNQDQWGDFLESGDPLVENMCRTYVAKNVQLAFNPSPSSAMEQATKELCDRLLFRIHIAVDPPGE